MAFDDLPGIRIIACRQMERPEVAPLARGEVAVYSAAGSGRADENEDGAAVVAVDDLRAVLAVADGLGGQRLGAEAAEMALRTLAGRVAAAGPAGMPMRGAILDGIEQANQRLVELGMGAGTTLAVAELDGSAVRSYHVGDSAIVVVGQRGRVKLQTVSHSPVGYALEAGLLDESEAIHHQDRHLVSNVVGSKEMRIEVGRTLELRPRDTLLLASDGLFDNLHVAEIAELVRRGPLDAAAEGLAEACRRRMAAPGQEHPSKPDDLTFLLYRPRAPSG